ncbi:unnamed protein product [Brassica oleracea var. botrytis]
MQTAVGVFGNEDNQPNMISKPSILALEVARDRNGVHPPDMRRNVSEYQTIFPTIDFSQAYIFFHFSFIYKSYSWKAILHIKLSQYIIYQQDNLWRPDVREFEEEILARGLQFMKWLGKRPEKEVAVVSHGIVLQHMLYVFANDCDVSVRHELCKRSYKKYVILCSFANCEIRTVVIVDKRLI